MAKAKFQTDKLNGQGLKWFKFPLAGKTYLKDVYLMLIDEIQMVPHVIPSDLMFTSESILDDNSTIVFNTPTILDELKDSGCDCLGGKWEVVFRRYLYLPNTPFVSTLPPDRNLEPLKSAYKIEDQFKSYNFSENLKEIFNNCSKLFNKPKVEFLTQPHNTYYQKIKNDNEFINKIDNDIPMWDSLTQEVKEVIENVTPDLSVAENVRQIHSITTNDIVVIESRFYPDASFFINYLYHAPLDNAIRTSNMNSRLNLDNISIVTTSKLFTSLKDTMDNFDELERDLIEDFNRGKRSTLNPPGGYLPYGPLYANEELMKKLKFSNYKRFTPKADTKRVYRELDFSNLFTIVKDGDDIIINYWDPLKPTVYDSDSLSFTKIVNGLKNSPDFHMKANIIKNHIVILELMKLGSNNLTECSDEEKEIFVNMLVSNWEDDIYRHKEF